MLLIQIVLVVFFLFAILKVFGRYRTNDLRLFGLIFWTVFWIAAGLVVLWPNSTMQLANLLGVGRGVDAIIYLALALLFFIFFRITVQVERLSRDVTKLTRKIALLEEKNRDTNPK